MKTAMIGAAAILMGTMLVGCTLFQGGKTMVKYDTSSVQGTVQSKATAAGTYGLFQSTDIIPIVRLEVPSGQDLGFRRNQDGQLEAFAGDRTFALDPSNNYFWKKL